MHEKPMPSNEAAEMQILGAIIFKGVEVYYEAASIIKAEDFYQEKHRLIWDMLTEFIEKKLPLDIPTLREKMPNINDIGGVPYLIKLFNSVHTAQNIKHHAEIVKQKSLARQGIKLCINAMGELYETEEVKETLSKTMTGYSNILAGEKKNEILHIKPIAHAVYGEICERMEHKEISGLRTGIVDFDEKIGGIKAGNFVVVAARTSIGKTSFILEIAKNVSQREPVLFFSLEMSKEELTEKIFSNYSNVSGGLLKNSRYMNESHIKQLNGSMSAIENSKLYIDDTAGIRLSDLIIKTRRFLSVHPDLKLIIVDYMQIMKSDTKGLSTKERIDELCTGMRDFAKEIKVPLICLSQINRGVETREDKRPTLADLKESGKQEEDANMVIMLYREDYYKDKGNDPSLTEVIIAKNRGGQVGTIKVMFHKAVSRFMAVDSNRTEAGKPYKDNDLDSLVKELNG
jgi:replicative DNA helicase